MAATPNQGCQLTQEQTSVPNPTSIQAFCQKVELEQNQVYEQRSIEWNCDMEESIRATRPYHQFQAECREMMDVLVKKQHAKTLDPPLTPWDILEGRARSAVQNNWIQDGIWNDAWEGMGIWKWKHEEPGPQVNQNGTLRDASRPVNRFFSEMTREVTEIMKDSKSTPGTALATINSTAYEKVRERWTKRRIWDSSWGTIPGLRWKHEQPKEQMLSEYGLTHDSTPLTPKRSPPPSSPKSNGSRSDTRDGSQRQSHAASIEERLRIDGCVITGVKEIARPLPQFPSYPPRGNIRAPAPVMYPPICNNSPQDHPWEQPRHNALRDPYSPHGIDRDSSDRNILNSTQTDLLRDGLRRGLFSPPPHDTSAVFAVHSRQTHPFPNQATTRSAFQQTGPSLENSPVAKNVRSPASNTTGVGPKTSEFLGIGAKASLRNVSRSRQTSRTEHIPLGPIHPTKVSKIVQNVRVKRDTSVPPIEPREFRDRSRKHRSF